MPENRPVKEPLRCALVGCGKVALKHLRAIRYHKNELQLAGLVDTRPAAAETLLRQGGVKEAEAVRIPFHKDLQTLLSAEKVDLVAITTPSGSHYALAKMALLAGKHVLVEKPLTLSLPQADELLDIACAGGLQIAVGHIYRYFPLVQALEADLRAGLFGRVLYGDVKVRWGHDQAYYDAAPWRGTWAEDGGVLMNQSIHALDLITWLLGGSVREASGMIERQTHRMEAEDLGLALLRLSNGTFCQLEGTTSTDPRQPEASFAVFCSDGTIQAGLRGGRPYVHAKDGRGRPLTGHYVRRFLGQIWRQGGIKALLQLPNPHSALYGDLIQAIRQQRPPLADGDSGRQAVAAVLTIYAAAFRQKTVTLPPESFTLADMAGYFAPFGDPPANH